MTLGANYGLVHNGIDHAEAPERAAGPAVPLPRTKP